LPQTKIIFFADGDGNSLFLIWLDRQPQKVQDKCIVLIELLEESGHDLHRPHADYLTDDIYELRTKRQGINYRILYFFFEKQAIISHGFIKQQSKVPKKEINMALNNKEEFLANPKKHTYKE